MPFHLDDRLQRELDELLAEIDFDYDRQKAAQTPGYTLPYSHLARLLALGLAEVPEDSGDFMIGVHDFAERLPECVARVVIQRLIDETDHAAGAVPRLFWETRWQAFGCPAISIESRLAASLMLSECPEEVLEDLQAPWGAFVVRLPAGLIDYEEVQYTHLAVHRYQSPPPPPLDELDLPPDIRRTAEKMGAYMAERQGTQWGLYGMSGERGHLQGEAPLIEHLGRAPRTYIVEPKLPIGDPGERIIALFARLAVGVCLLAQSEGALRRKSTKKKERGPSRMGKGPTTTEYVLGQKVTVGFNCVDAVKEYVRGDARSLPAIQWLVRGHWRNQPIGPGRTERKRIWIMPHWRGPQEAPKLFREYEFKPSLALSPADGDVDG